MGTNWSGGCHSSVELPSHVAVLEGEWIEWWEGPVVGGVSGERSQWWRGCVYIMVYR